MSCKREKVFVRFRTNALKRSLQYSQSKSHRIDHTDGTNVNHFKSEIMRHVHVRSCEDHGTWFRSSRTANDHWLHKHQQDSRTEIFTLPLRNSTRFESTTWNDIVVISSLTPMSIYYKRTHPLKIDSTNYCILNGHRTSLETAQTCTL